MVEYGWKWICVPGDSGGMIYDVRLQRLELDSVSHNSILTTLDIISPGLDRFHPPRRSDPHPDFGSAMRSGGMGTPEIARPKSSPPPATRHACVLYKKQKNKKNKKKVIFLDLFLLISKKRSFTILIRYRDHNSLTYP